MKRKSMASAFALVVGRRLTLTISINKCNFGRIKELLQQRLQKFFNRARIQARQMEKEESKYLGDKAGVFQINPQGFGQEDEELIDYIIEGKKYLQHHLMHRDQSFLPFDSPFEEDLSFLFYGQTDSIPIELPGGDHEQHEPTQKLEGQTSQSQEAEQERLESDFEGLEELPDQPDRKNQEIKINVQTPNKATTQNNGGQSGKSETGKSKKLLKGLLNLQKQLLKDFFANRADLIPVQVFSKDKKNVPTRRYFQRLLFDKTLRCELAGMFSGGYAMRQFQNTRLHAYNRLTFIRKHRLLVKSFLKGKLLNLS